MRNQAKGLLFVMAAAVLFGVMPLWAVKVYDCGGNPVFLSFCRFALSLPLLYALDRRLYPAGRARVPAGRFALVCVPYVLTPSLLFLSYTFIASGVASTLHFLFPAVVLLLCRAVFRQKIPPVKYLCCLMCIAGVALFYTTGDSAHGAGLLLALLSALTYGVYVVYLPASGLQERLSPFRLTLWLNLAGTVLLALLVTAMDAWAFSLSWAGWLYTLLLSWGTAVGATMLFQRGVKLCGAQNAALFSVLEPLTSVVCGLLLLREPWSPRILTGIALILGAVFLLSLWDFRAAKAQALPPNRGTP